MLPYTIEQKSPFVGIYDSGLGGLGVWRAMQQVIPQERFKYLGDTARVPYGERNANEIRRFSREIIGFLYSQGAKMVIAACNTSSALALPVLKDEVPIPLIGMIQPAVQQTLQLTRTRRVGVMATAATVHSSAYERSFAQLDANIDVIAVACPQLVPLIETGCTHSNAMSAALTEYVLPLRTAQVDCIILGCTHYPLVADQIAALAGDGITLIDPAFAVAQQAKVQLTQMHMRNTLKSEDDEVFVTGGVTKFAQEAAHLGFQLPQPIRQVNLAGMAAWLSDVRGSNLCSGRGNRQR